MTDETPNPLALRLRPEDTVAVVVQPVEKGTTVCVAGPGDPLSVTSTADIPCYHKLALAPIPRDAAVVRNGIAIGRSTTAINTGDWVHIHNLVSLRAQSRRNDTD